jgi:hypothetical protein
MSEARTQPVKAARVDVVNSECAPGSFKFYVQGSSVYKKYADTGDGVPHGMVYQCPCGCKNVGVLPFKPSPDRASWGWDGNTEAPTLTPSVWDKGHWHGWLRAGVWESV